MLLSGGSNAHVKCLLLRSTFFASGLRVCESEKDVYVLRVCRECPKEVPAADDPPVSSPASEEAADQDASTVTSPDSETSAKTADAEDLEGVSQPDSTQVDDAEASSGIVPGQFDSVPEEEEDSQTGTGHGEATAQAGAAGIPKTMAVTEEKQRREWFVEDIEKEWRRFSFDLAPKVCWFAVIVTGR